MFVPVFAYIALWLDLKFLYNAFRRFFSQEENYLGAIDFSQVYISFVTNQVDSLG